MLLREDGSTIEVQVFDAKPHPIERREGVRPGVIADRIILKRREEDGTRSFHPYLPLSLIEPILQRYKETKEAVGFPPNEDYERLVTAYDQLVDRGYVAK